ncbi:MAG: hypothetical protein IJ279_03070 [Clostridia bacterium]|nr:hypothetical protein [Clostridia bacterium]
MDFISEILLEIFGEVYPEIMTAVCPEAKLKKWQMKMIIGTEALVLIILLIIGAVMLCETDGESVWGKILLYPSSVIIVLQMTFGIITILKNIRENKSGFNNKHPKSQMLLGCLSILSVIFYWSSPNSAM